ncbi:MAG: adenine deaminase [Desulfobacterales bacterium]|nr:adenine deaminase [Desulfobacterales bacterium]
MDVALGRLPADLVITNAAIVNVYTAEIQEEMTIAVKDQWIAYAGTASEIFVGAETRIIDASGKTVIPGLIDGHTHLAALFCVDPFLRQVIPGGTTTIVTESFEPYPVAGLDGVLDFLDSLTCQPIKIFATAPAMVSTSPAAMGIRPDDLQTILRRGDVLGIGESYWQGLFQKPARLLPELAAAAAMGKTIEGHSAGARGHKLQAYAAMGVSSCHEPITAEETLDRLRLGFYVMAREGSIRSDLETIAGIQNSNVDLRRLIISTDGVQPVDLVEKGYMEHVLQRAIDSGFEPARAVQMATLNVAEHFGIDTIVGAIAPGKCADMVILTDLRNIRPELVISKGRPVAEDGRLLVEPRKHVFSSASLHTINLPREIQPADFEITAPEADQVEVRVIEMVTDLVTAQTNISVPVFAGKVACDPCRNLIKVAAVDRTRSPGKTFTGLIRGFGLSTGAVACSAAWDTSDIIVVGADEADMALCVNRIEQLQGGAVVCSRGVVAAELALPIFGMMCELPIIKLAEKIRAVNKAAGGLGVPFPDPLLTLITLTGAAIPYFRICEEGLVNLKDGRVVGLINPKVA